MKALRPTVLTVSLGRIAANFRAVRARVGPLPLMAVVKADAYGHGMLPVAQRLVAEGARALAVATADEAIDLREAGLRAQILILGGATAEAAEAAVAARVAIAAYDQETLLAAERAAASLGSPAAVHVKIDTGMTRVGARGEDALRKLLEAFRDCPHVRMEGIFTHFADADGDPAFTSLQNERFLRAVSMARAAGHRPIAHAAASAALVLDERLWHDMARPGIALYGASVREHLPGIAPAQRLTTRPVRVAECEAGETVGYGRTFAAGRPSKIMTLPIGYGDGYPRVLGNRAQVLVRGLRARVVGRVCMDQIMVDVTDVPGAGMDDEVVLLGAQASDAITPDELARWADTIPYEIMLGFHGRVHRKVIE